MPEVKYMREISSGYEVWGVADADGNRWFPFGGRETAQLVIDRGDWASYGHTPLSGMAEVTDTECSERKINEGWINITADGFPADPRWETSNTEVTYIPAREGELLRGQVRESSYGGGWKISSICTRCGYCELSAGDIAVCPQCGGEQVYNFAVPR